MTVTTISCTIADAAEATGFSADTIRRAIRKTRDDGVFPHPLTGAKKAAGKYIIPTTALESWVDKLPDA